MPPSASGDHRAFAIAGACVALGLAVLAAALLWAGSDTPTAPKPPAPIAVAAATTPAPTPAPSTPAPAVAPAAPSGDTGKAAADAVVATAKSTWERLFADNGAKHVPASWVAGFYPLYDRAQKAFGVNWLLLASIHRQETAFSTHPTTYRGLNFARCCAGPMQFNVTNGPSTTWDRFNSAYKQAERPASYPNMRAKHPSVYDDFDAMMAAASLLKSSGASSALDGTAWMAAFDYYGHDLVGVDYANQVVARAIHWSQHGFTINQGVDQAMLEAVDAAWGAPMRAQLTAADEAQEKRDKERKQHAREAKAGAEKP